MNKLRVMLATLGVIGWTVTAVVGGWQANSWYRNEYLPHLEAAAVQKCFVDPVPVESVADGDTIRVRACGRSWPVRFVGVDTPETIDPRRPKQCFGEEASEFTKKLLSGKLVRLEFDERVGTLDEKDRLLAYVYLGNVLVNEKLIREGYAREYRYKRKYKYDAEFKQAQAEARTRQVGFWSPRTCNGKVW